MPKIDTYSFGRMTVDGQVLTSDLIVLPDGAVQSDWWRETGHRLVVADIESLLDAAPAVLVVGTGASGLMVVSDEVLEACRARGIEVCAMPTGEAVQEYNLRVAAGTRVGAGFHLTC